MPGLGPRLRARWRALLDAAWLDRRQSVDSGAIAGSQYTDTEAVDLRPRVRMPGPDARSEGPPAEWLEYVLAQDPVWVDGGLGQSERALDSPALSTDVSTLTSQTHTGPAEQRSVAVPRPGRRPHARFVRPAPPAEHITPEPPPIRPFVDTPTTGRTYAPSLPMSTNTAAPTRTYRRLLPRREPAPSALSPAAPLVPVADPDDGSRPAFNFPDAPTATIHRESPPVWPVAVATTAPSTLHQVSERHATAPAGAARAVLVRATLTAAAPAPRAVLPHPTTTAHALDRPRATLAQTHLRPVVDPWASTSSPAPVVELRRDLDDRPAPADPPVAVRWRAIDIDRLASEQRAL